MQIFRLFAMSFLVLLLPRGATSHEFWIDPTGFQLPSGATVAADLRVGEAFKGGSQPYLPHSTRRFELILGERTLPATSTIGDRPALNQAVEGGGLVTIVHVTGDSALTYSEFDKFESFVTHKDADWTLEAHRSRGLPETGFREVYSRYAKSLVALGDGAGADVELGLETEFLALENPYTDDLSDGFDVALIYQGKPRSDAQIEVFERDAADDSVTVSVVRTDDAGRATIPVVPGKTYMLDAVVLREPSPDLAEARNAVWESLWANLTFSAPR